jgi:hypothetical protein
MWVAIGRVLAALAFGGSIAAVAILVGTRDLESYEHVIFSLNRGTASRGSASPPTRAG